MPTLDAALASVLTPWAGRMRQRANLPLLLRWGPEPGAALPLGDARPPRVTLHLRHPAAVPALLSPSLDRLGEAYVEGLRRHYARTTQLWSEAYEAATPRLKALVGEKRWRIWRMYLIGSHWAFERDQISLYQVLARRAGRSAGGQPWSRNWMLDAGRGKRVAGPMGLVGTIGMIRRCCRQRFRLAARTPAAAAAATGCATAC